MYPNKPYYNLVGKTPISPGVARHAHLVDRYIATLFGGESNHLIAVTNIMMGDVSRGGFAPRASSILNVQ